MFEAVILFMSALSANLQMTLLLC